MVVLSIRYLQRSMAGKNIRQMAYDECNAPPDKNKSGANGIAPDLFGNSLSLILLERRIVGNVTNWVAVVCRNENMYDSMAELQGIEMW